MLKWFRSRREAARLAQAHAVALVREQGDDEAYGRALEIARDMVLANRIPMRRWFLLRRGIRSTTRRFM